MQKWQFVQLIHGKPRLDPRTPGDTHGATASIKKSIITSQFLRKNGMLELHVWGPAFGLPSIDAHCLAAIAYLQQAVPRGKWQLIASSNPVQSPTNELPALFNTDNDIWIGGLRNIFHYLAQISAGEWVLDVGLSKQEGADCIAFSSYVESHGQPLIDLSLYVSSQNYASITRPIFNTIQPFPLPYLTPPSLRATAKARTEHLGLSSLDIDTEDGEPSPSQSIIPESLRRPKNTVSSLLAASPEKNAQIRLDALATDFFEPLDKLRGKKKFLVSDSQLTSLDCLALGFLSLMLVPELPQQWLANTMEKKFPELCEWTQDLRKTIFSSSVSLNDAYLTRLGDSQLDIRLQRLRGKGHLPWRARKNESALSVGGAFLSSITDSLPVVGQLRRNTRMQQHAGDGSHSNSWQYLGLIGSVIAGLGLVAGYMFHEGILPFGQLEPKRRGGLGDFGEAGEALSFFAAQMDKEAERQRMLERNSGSHGEPIVEVDRDGVTASDRIT